MSSDAAGSRVSMLIRLVGLFFVGLGTTLAYFTYIEAVALDIVPQIVPVFYLGAFLMIAVGLAALVVRYK
jgi:hypothetical protein